VGTTALIHPDPKRTYKITVWEVGCLLQLDNRINKAV